MPSRLGGKVVTVPLTTVQGNYFGIGLPITCLILFCLKMAKVLQDFLVHSTLKRSYKEGKRVLEIQKGNKKLRSFPKYTRCESTTAGKSSPET